MNKKFIKILVGIVFIALLLGPVAACSNTSDPSGKDSSSENTPAPSSSEEMATSTADPTAPQDKTYTISWIGAQNQPLSDDPILIKKWEEQFNVKIDFWNIDSNSWDEVLSTKFAGGEIPDVLYVNSASNFSNYVEQQLLAEIPPEMLEKYIPKTIASLQEDYERILLLGQKDGKQYTIPIGTYFHNQFHEPIVYRGDWMEKVGVTSAPTTLEEFENLMYKFSNDDPDGNGAKNTYGLSTSGLNMVYGAFGFQRKQWVEQDGKLVYSSIQPEMKDALAVLAKWYKDGAIDPEFITGENKGGYWAISNAFTEGRIGYSGHGGYYHWIPDLGPINEATGKASVIAGANYAELEKNSPGVGSRLVHGVPVTGPNGKSGSVGYALPHSHSVGFGIQLEDEPDKMAKIMTMYEYWTSDPEHWFEARLGIKDEMWHYNEDGVPVSDFEAWKEKNNKPDESLSGIGGHTVLEPFLLSNIDEIQNKYLYDWATENKYDKGLIKSELLISLPSAGTYQTELDKIEDEAYIAIITGNKPVDYFDTFVEEYKKAGYETLAKEANEWWDTMK
ncbi:MAG TPA: ABC transporter substrate-binding protein [Clostridiales bacterium]|nr:ABC transporter substrate-binding protein [Clostridiales bacterium]